ncbi:response regulator [Desulfovibrio aminophilus]|uniref:response regulator n=1 Tax=Desulfovibrio aminophilus TaxID=81425 RepID=UPI00040A5E02|nr:response regulator [Desulfovibrio aminophilus]
MELIDSFKESKAFRHFRHVAVISANKIHAKRDAQQMKCFAPERVSFFESAEEAVAALERDRADLLLLDSTLADMNGLDFLRLLRGRKPLKGLPAIMITLENSRDYILDAIDAGCAGYILRPYSLKTLEQYLLAAKHLQGYLEIEDEQLREGRELLAAGDPDEAIVAFEEIVGTRDEARRYYDLGCGYLLENKYGKAILSFKKAVKLNELFAEAYKGLADAFKPRATIQNTWNTWSTRPRPSPRRTAWRRPSRPSSRSSSTTRTCPTPSIPWAYGCARRGTSRARCMPT